MDRSTEKQRIAEADLLIGDAERAVAHQMTEIERLRVEGHDTTKVEELVRAFRRTLKTLQEDRQRMLKSIAFDGTVRNLVCEAIMMSRRSIIWRSRKSCLTNF